MTGQWAKPRLRSTLYRLVALVAGLNLLVFAIIGLALYRGYQQTREQAVVEAENLSRVLEENLNRFVDKIDLTLMAVTDEITRQERAGGIEPAALQAFIARHDARLPEALGLRVVNAAGTIEYAVSNVTQSGASVADRDHFIQHRDKPDLGLTISRPIIGRLNPQPMIIAARRRTAPDGSFAGIVHVAIAVSSLQSMFAAVDLGEHGSVGLWNDAPILLGRFSKVESGAPKPSDTLRELIHGHHGPTAYHTLSGVDGIKRIFYFRQVGQWPLYLVVGIADRDSMVPWWREFRLLAGLAALFLLSSILATRAIGRVMRALDNARAEAEVARRRSELVLGSAGEGICGTDAHGRVMFANQAARRLLGWNDDEGDGWNFHAAIHHHHADGSVYRDEDCPATRLLTSADPTPRHVEGEVYWRRDGTSFPVEYTLAPVMEGDRIAGVVNIFRDISERQRIESERTHTLAVTQALANILRLSLDGMSLANMLDAALGELLSLPWLQLEHQACIFLLDADGATLHMAAQRNLPHQVCTGCTTVAVGQCLCGQAAATNAVVFADCTAPHHATTFDGMAPHGHYCVPIGTASERLGVLNAYVAHGHRHDPAEERFLTMAADTLAGMIKRKRTEETLLLSQQRANALLNAPTDAAFLVDRATTVLACNEAMASRFGCRIDEVIGQPFDAMIPPEVASQRRAAFERVLKTGEPQEFHDERDGVALDNRLYPIFDTAGQVVQVAVFSRDVTAQQQAARTVETALAELARSNEELQQFAYVASHDLRQPLRMVTSYLNLIERRLGDRLDGEIKEFMDYATDGARRMDGLIIDLLDYSRAGKGSAPFAPIDLEPVLTDAQLNLQVAIEEAAAEIIVADDLPAVMGDSNELTRLFQNLIGNAVKYRAADRPPCVQVGWRRDGVSVVVWVRDNGIGIDPADYERAFRVFQRLVPSTSCEGSGIGLAVCRKIVAHHCGRIWIESIPGEGSTFFVALPAAP